MISVESLETVLRVLTQKMIFRPDGDEAVTAEFIAVQQAVRELREELERRA